MNLIEKLGLEKCKQIVENHATFTAQPFFKNLRFIHGDKLFDFDKGIGYRNLTVQVGYVCFCKGDGEFVLND